MLKNNFCARCLYVCMSQQTISGTIKTSNLKFGMSLGQGFPAFFVLSLPEILLLCSCPNIFIFFYVSS